MDTQTKTIQMLSESISKSKDVVASFKLSQNSIKAISWLNKSWGTSNKKLFDLIWNDNNESFFEIVKEIKYNPNIKRKKISQRISKQSLNNLNKLAKKYEMKRDVIVELTFISYKMFFEKMLNERNEKHRKVLEMINDYWDKGEALEKKLKKVLDKDDPILERMGIVNVITSTLSLAIQSELEDGIIIDPEDFSQSC
jgi:hypothetical protein